MKNRFAKLFISLKMPTSIEIVSTRDAMVLWTVSLVIIYGNAKSDLVPPTCV